MKGYAQKFYPVGRSPTMARMTQPEDFANVGQTSRKCGAQAMQLSLGLVLVVFFAMIVSIWTDIRFAMAAFRKVQPAGPHAKNDSARH